MYVYLIFRHYEKSITVFNVSYIFAVTEFISQFMDNLSSYYRSIISIS